MILDYILLFLAVTCIAAQFNINKLYQKNFVRGLKDILFFPFINGVTGFVFFGILSFALYNKPPDFSAFSFVMSITLALVSTMSALVGILIMRYGKMSVYSVFMMLGGMILPYFYGILFLSETPSVARITGLAVLIFALPCSVADPDKKNNKTAARLYYFLCAFIFILNGSVSIISKSHSINISAVPAANFILYANFWAMLINGALYFILTPRIEKLGKTIGGFSPSEIQETTETKSAHKKLYAGLIVVICAVVGGTGYLFQLVAAQTVPAVAMFPFVTGGSIVLSTVLAWIFFKEKPGKLAAAGIIMAFAGTLLFLF